MYTGSPILTQCTTFIGDGLEQPFAAYTLARFGHNTVYVPDGGLDTWRSENRPLSQLFPSARPSDFTATVRSDYFVTYDEFRAMKDLPDVMTLDARPRRSMKDRGPGSSPVTSPAPSVYPGKRS